MAAIFWDYGTAYDFFISLFVLHHQDRFGLRAQWAAGVRSRLPGEQRLFLEETIEFLPVPLTFIFNLPEDGKTAAGALKYLGDIPPESRLLRLMNRTNLTPAVQSVVETLSGQQEATAEQLEMLKEYYQYRPVPIKTKEIQKLAEACMQPAIFGEKLQQAFETYYQVFFAEEEERIRPLLKEGLQNAQALAQELALPQLLEELSHGVSYQSIDRLRRVNLVPSYWSTPLVFMNNLAEDEMLMIFGCRPDTQNLVPGEYVPEVLINTMKVLSDSTRLRILRYLNQSPDSPSGLARKLRLRAPTVVHHLNKLRLAGLVQVIISQQGDRQYALRKEALRTVMANLQVFLETSELDDPVMDGDSNDV
ncbi:MAG: hypothetical protein CL609_08205 [Anaerolineaceae bacterium]|nr:hypothetical protein [Anaerolineaceae bacterium]